MVHFFGYPQDISKFKQFAKKKKILLNSLKTKYHDNLINITTTNKNNLKIFFSQLKKFLNK